MKEEKTNAIRLLEQKKIKFVVHNYLSSGAISGIDVANSLNEDPNIVFKTLVTQGKSHQYYVFLVPVNKELDLKFYVYNKGQIKLHHQYLSQIYNLLYLVQLQMNMYLLLNYQKYNIHHYWY